MPKALKVATYDFFFIIIVFINDLVIIKIDAVLVITIIVIVITNSYAVHYLQYLLCWHN